MLRGLLIGGGCFMLSLCSAVAGEWSESLAAKFSARWRTIQQTKEDNRAVLATLPILTESDVGGTAGYMSEPASSKTGDSKWIEVQWPKPALIDEVALLPARLFDEHGLAPQHGMPEDFKVQLLDEAGKPMQTIAAERQAWADPVRRGHPFVYTLNPAVRCSGVRIESSRLHRDPLRQQPGAIMAWSEICCFEGNKNVARGAKVRAGDPRKIPWPWSPDFVVDGQTCLGLPELPAPELQEIGWLSGPRGRPDEGAWVQIDLGSLKVIDAMGIYPVIRPAADRMPGFALPKRFLVEVSPSGEEGSYSPVFDHSTKDYENPGHHLMSLRWKPTEARFVRLRASVLWKISNAYPAFLSMSEVTILSDTQNVARNCSVTSSDNTGRVGAHGDLFWSESSLTNGYSSSGRLVSTRQWLEALQQRYMTELAIFELERESDQIVNRIARGVAIAGALALSLIVGALFVLPAWYRIRERRRLGQIRKKLAGDLHDDIGSNLGAVELLAEAAVRRPHAAERYLRDIRAISTESVTSLRDIIWLLRPESGRRSLVAEQLREKADIMLEGFEWKFQMNAAAAACELSPDTARQLLLYFKETLHNIVRHSGGKTVNVQISVEDGEFMLEVSDDGEGISLEKQSSEQCLRALRERALRLNGVMKLTSEDAQRTTITLRFPISGKRSKKAL